MDEHPTPEDVVGEHRLDSPIAPPPPDTAAARAAWRWTTTAILAATLLLAAFDAPAVQGWFDELAPTPLTERLRAPVAGWSAATARLDAPGAWLRARWQAARRLRFGREEPGERGEAAGG